MPKCDFNKAASNFFEIVLRLGCSPANLLHISRIPFPRNTSWWLVLNIHSALDIIDLFKCFREIMTDRKNGFLPLMLSKNRIF